MVSIRYFCGVGEFCRVNSMPRGSLTSKTGTVAAAHNIAPAAMSTKKDNTRRKIFNSPSPYSLSISLPRADCIPPHKTISLGSARRCSARRFPLHEPGRNQNSLGQRSALGPDSLDEKFGRPLAHGAGSLINGAQRHRNPIGVLNV